MHRLGADVSGHALECVCEALREGRVALGQRGRGLPDGRALLFDELAEEFQIELPVARDAVQAVFRVQTGNGWQVIRLRRAAFRPLRLRGQRG